MKSVVCLGLALLAMSAPAMGDYPKAGRRPARDSKSNIGTTPIGARVVFTRDRSAFRSFEAIRRANDPKLETGEGIDVDKLMIIPAGTRAHVLSAEEIPTKMDGGYRAINFLLDSGPDKGHSVWARDQKQNAWRVVP